MLQCEVCYEFEDKLCVMPNYRPAFIESMPNNHASTFKDHVGMNMHKGAMELVAKDTASSVLDYAKAMAQAKVSKLKIKMDIANMFAKENLAFTKKKVTCELEEWHGIWIQK